MNGGTRAPDDLVFALLDQMHCQPYDVRIHD